MNCVECGIEINPQHRDLDTYCDCCLSLLGSIMTPWFKRWHRQEYVAQVLAKKRIMEGAR